MDTVSPKLRSDMNSNKLFSEKPSDGSYNNGIQLGQHPISSSKYAIMTFQGGDRVLLCGFPPNTIQAIHEIIPLMWTQGIQEQAVWDRTNLIKLAGYPWSHSSSVDRSVIESRRLVCAMLQVLFNQGWILETTTNLTGAEEGMGKAIFKNGPVLPSRQWFSVNFYSADRILFIDAPDQLCHALASRLGSVLSDHGFEKGAYFLKFQGFPLTLRYRDDKSLYILLDIMEVLDQYGFQLYTSVDLASRPKHRDSWICCSK